MDPKDNKDFTNDVINALSSLQAQPPKATVLHELADKGYSKLQFDFPVRFAFAWGIYCCTVHMNTHHA